MNIGIINVDEMYSHKKVPNLALEKIRYYHELKGDTVTYNDNMSLIFADKVYVSVIFSWNKERCEVYAKYPNVEIGGSGWDITKKLPDEIENLRPPVNFGFLTRGCIRKCPWCIVPKKDGMIRKVSNLVDLWDKKSKTVIILDDNILALPEHFKSCCQEAIDNKIKLDFHALDIRLLNADNVEWLGKTPHEEYNFAFDEPANKNMVDKGITLLKANGVKRSTFYVLVGFNTTFEEDLYRCEFLKSRYQNAFTIRYNKIWNKMLIGLNMWTNQKHIFQGMTFAQFLHYPQYESYRGVVEEYFKAKGMDFYKFYEELIASIAEENKDKN